MLLGAAKTWTETCESEGMPKQQSKRQVKRQEGGKPVMGRGGRGAPADPAYLPLQHQLFAEQHGLVAERLRHLRPYGRIPGTAWTFDTCGRQGPKNRVSAVVAVANHGRGGGRGRYEKFEHYPAFRNSKDHSRAPACVRGDKKVRAKIV